MKKEIQKSSLLIFYKLISELSSIGFKGELEIGVSEQEFDKFKLENFAFMYKADKKSINDYESSNEFKFNTGSGVLTIYNKDVV